MYARHRLDLTHSDLEFALMALAQRRQPEPPAAGTLRCLSVRSGFDLLLGSLRLAPGGEVVFSAVTHPDLPRLCEHHGLVPVPVDLDLDTLAPDLGLLEAALTPRTRLVVVAHLFGGLVGLRDVLYLAGRRGVPVIEDCAQAYAGPDYSGDPGATVSMFSFGLLKTATAAGGAVLRVRDAALLRAMDRGQASWPVQDGHSYAGKVLLAAGLMAGGRPLPYGLVAALHSAWGRDLDRTVNGAVRSFGSGSSLELLHRLRRRPSRALEAVLERRLATFDPRRLARRGAAGELAQSLLPAGLPHPGGALLRRTHWLFPVIAADPDWLVRAARAAGFDAGRAASNLCTVAAPDGRAHLVPRQAAQMMAGLVYLPMYPEIPERQRRRLLGEVLQGCADREPPGAPRPKQFHRV